MTMTRLLQLNIDEGYSWSRVSVEKDAQGEPKAPHLQVKLDKGPMGSQERAHQVTIVPIPSEHGYSTLGRIRLKTTARTSTCALLAAVGRRMAW